LCSECNKKRELKMYCPICEQFWPDCVNAANAADAESENEKPGIEGMAMIECGLCLMKVHVSCDRMLADPGTLARFTQSSKATLDEV